MSDPLPDERLAEIEADARGRWAEDRRGATPTDTLALVAEVRRLRALPQKWPEIQRAVAQQVDHNCAGPCPCAVCRAEKAEVRAGRLYAALSVLVSWLEGGDGARGEPHPIGPARGALAAYRAARGAAP